MNTPLETVKLLKPYIEGKTFCDLGCGDGKFLKEVSKYATVTGIENSVTNFEKCQAKGLDIIFGDLREDVWPDSEVYYSYPFFHDVKIMMETLPLDSILIIGSDSYKFDQGDFPEELSSQIIINEFPDWRIAIWRKQYEK